MKALYALNPEQLVAMSTRPKRPQLQGFYIWFSPVIDAWVLPMPLDKAIVMNKWNKVPLLLGSNMHEGAYFQREKPTSDITEYYRLLSKDGLGDDLEILSKIYTVKDSSEILEQSQQLVGDLGFGAPARALARMAIKKGEKAFLYHFTRTSKDTTGRFVKALHSTELPFVFGYTVDKWVPYKRFNGINTNDAFLAQVMSDYWLNFAKYGNPNGNAFNTKLQTWPVYETKTNSYLELGEEIKPMINLRKLQYDGIDHFSKQKGEFRY